MFWEVHQPSQATFTLASGICWLLVVVLAATLRTRSYAIARGVLMGLHIAIARALWPHVGAFWPIFAYLHLCIFIHSGALIRPRMRPLWYRVLVSWPEAFFQAGTLLSFPWAIAYGFGSAWEGLGGMYVFAAIGMAQSFAKHEVEPIDLVVRDVEPVEGPSRVGPGAARVDRPLRIAQLTDTHLGAFMSAERLNGICQRAVEAEPDLVMLTGDFLTMESQSDPSVLAHAFAPLAALEGRVFACLGNHDLEAPETVRKALAQVGARLLVDEVAVVDTDAGRVQILGVDFRWRGRAEHLKEVCAAHPREDGALRLVLLHDPGAFKALPEGEGDLVLSGHTHGGQVGFLSLGWSFTLMRLFTKSPDHGYWGRGKDRLYVHRGTGHYGFPVRIGVPSEESLLRVHAPS